MTHSTQSLILTNLQIHTEQGIQPEASLVIQNQKIHSILTHKEQIKKFPDAGIIEFSEDYHLVPGFIDLHVHGANGSDVMDATPEALQNMCETLAKEGTTSFLATTMTATPDEIGSALVVVRDYIQQQDNNRGAKILGVHLEGPFISPQKVGAQPANKVMSPRIEYIEDWQELTNNVIKLVTLAPELVDSLEVIEYLTQKNIIASIGHTNATYAETIAAIDAGCSYATHLFNAMRGMHQREPGAVTAALLAETLTAELILDGHHLHPAIVQLALKLKTKDKLVLVTDAMRAKCLKNGVYDLGGQPVTVKHDKATLADGTLAGSVLRMNSALQNMLRYTGCSLSDALQMAAENPARKLKIFHQKGSIIPAKDADLIVLDKDIKVVMTIVEGRIVFQA